MGFQIDIRANGSKPHENKPIRNVSIEFEPPGKPMHITLWRPDGSGLRMEIGVLRFSQFKSPSGSEVMLPLAPEFNQQVDAFKLVVHESGVRAESGILLRARNGCISLHDRG